MKWSRGERGVGAQLLAQQTQVRRAGRGQESAGGVRGAQTALPGPHLPSPGTPNLQECVPKAPPVLCPQGCAEEESRQCPPSKYAMPPPPVPPKPSEGVL